MEDALASLLADPEAPITNRCERCTWEYRARSARLAGVGSCGQRAEALFFAQWAGQGWRL